MLTVLKKSEPIIFTNMTTFYHSLKKIMAHVQNNEYSSVNIDLIYLTEMSDYEMVKIFKLYL